ncbi:MAG TPA: hypothetical protein VHL11_23770 [Phototrophicaceae bacterium]|jgi:hypothetical protein|nr:hypothetical protein [Phototrophicaceae bacterium]
MSGNRCLEIANANYLAMKNNSPSPCRFRSPKALGLELYLAQDPPNFKSVAP